MKLVIGGNPAFRILLPKKPTPREQFAAEELARVVKVSTGKNLQVDHEVKEGVQYISLGKTLLAKCPDPALGDSGYLLSAKEEAVTICGVSDRGTIYGVYDLLERWFGYRFYAKDCEKIEIQEDVDTGELEISFKPDIEFRTIGYSKDTWEEDSPYLHRLKLSGSLYSGWVLATHTYFQILPKDRYYKDHPDWYSPDGKNLCLSNKEMRAEFLQRMKELIAARPDADFMMMGQEDTFEFCDCPACRKAIKEYGSESAVMMRFSNEMAREIASWLKETYPDRKPLTLVTFAYNRTYAPPVREENGKFVPLDAEVVAEDNLAVMLVPYCTTTVYSASFLDTKHNEKTSRTLLGWKAVAKRLHIWVYNVSFDNYMYPFCDWDALGENYRIFKNFGVQFLFQEGNHETGYDPFHDLKIYARSRLMWDSSLDTEELYSDFIKNYFQEAAPYMAHYFQGVRECWREAEQKYGVELKSSTYLSNREYWPEEYLKSWLEDFEKAKKAICECEPERKKVLAERLLRESLSPRYMMIHLHSDWYGDRLQTTIDEFLTDCAKFGIECFGWYHNDEIIRDPSKKRMFEE